MKILFLFFQIFLNYMNKNKMRIMQQNLVLHIIGKNDKRFSFFFLQKSDIFLINILIMMLMLRWSRSSLVVNSILDDWVKLFFQKRMLCNFSTSKTYQHMVRSQKFLSYVNYFFENIRCVLVFSLITKALNKREKNHYSDMKDSENTANE